MHPEAARATLSRPARRFNAGASERSRPLCPGMNAALTVYTRVLYGCNFIDLVHLPLDL